MKQVIITTVISILMLAACRNTNSVTQPKQYEAWLQETGKPIGLQRIDTEIQFWSNRLAKNPGDLSSQIKLAGLYSNRYSCSGSIEELQKSDSFYKVANQLQSKFGSGLYRSLAANCVTQHQFIAAKAYLDTALMMGDDKRLAALQAFDVALELGNTLYATALLKQLATRKDVDYLIRLAKYEDHVKGDLPAAIATMEAALEKIDTANNAMYCWAASNLADMYSHDNRFHDAYFLYQQVLTINKHYYHALKGIAWLAFSVDKDAENAKKIFTYLQLQHTVPDYDLLLAQVLRYQKDEAAANNRMNKFLAETAKPQYGGMYNKYRFYLYSDVLNNNTAAMQIAQTEVSNRPTPESYNFLCWAYYKAGNITEALKVAQRYVEDKCFEPDALYHLGALYYASGNTVKAKNYLQQAAESAAELGPENAAAIYQLLQKI